MKALLPAVLGLIALGPAPLGAQQARPEPNFKDVVYGSENPASQRLDVYLAKSDDPAPKPTMIYLHGGGWRAGSKAPIPAFLARGVAEGWLSVVAIEYRFTDIAPHPAQVNDCVRGIQFARSKAKEWNLDPRRFGVTGGSAGGHLSLWIGLHDDAAKPDDADPVRRESSRVSCVVDFAGPSDWGLLGTIDHKHPAYRQLLGYEPGTPAAEMDAAKKSDVSPVTFVSKDDPPVIVFHGDADDIVPIEHAKNVASLLEKSGVPVELFIVPGGKHNVAGGAGEGVQERAYAYVREHLLGAEKAGATR
ncbi:MAG: alpha/beta hydrolase [Akkermansiaceae bacterium]|nr:alpha/beta hydrolase [Akkermansiaceae bacterium]